MDAPLIEVRSPGRLHFGLLAYSPDVPRQFGGVGLMVQQPGVRLQLSPLPGGRFVGHGRMSDRAAAFAEQFARQAQQRGLAEQIGGAAIRVLRVPRPHTGLGSGTQLGMAVAMAMAAAMGREDWDSAILASLVGRGRRSGIGVHGSQLGGLIVDGGKTDPNRLATLVARHPFPENWRIVLVRPVSLTGLAGQREQQAFTQMPAIAQAITDRLCRLVLMGLVPCMLERDWQGFGEALFELQQQVGQCFKRAQGGVYADPLLERIVTFIRSRGMAGVGQSSWGPTLYTVTPDQAAAEALVADLHRHFDLEPGELLITQADNRGSVLHRHAVSA